MTCNYLMLALSAVVYDLRLTHVGITHTLSGHVGKVVASHAEVARSIPGCAETAPIYTMHVALRGYCP